MILKFLKGYIEARFSINFPMGKDKDIEQLFKVAGGVIHKLRLQQLGGGTLLSLAVSPAENRGAWEGWSPLKNQNLYLT